MSNFPFRSSKSRLTKKQQLRNELNDLILLYFLKHDEYVAAETVRLELVASGQHISIPALPFYRYRKTIQKPLKQGYPLHPQTIGEHIKKVRMEKGLLQKDVAEIMKVSEDSITYWENGRASPQIHHYPRIIKFLEYYPFPYETESISGKIRHLRYCNGYSYKEMGAMLSIDGSTVRVWELKKGMPKVPVQSHIERLWAFLPKFITNHFKINY